MELGGSGNLPWVVFGDFNDITRQYEKQGGWFCAGSSSRGLRQFMEGMRFVDLGFSGRNSLGVMEGLGWLPLERD